MIRRFVAVVCLILATYGLALPAAAADSEKASGAPDTMETKITKPGAGEKVDLSLKYKPGKYVLKMDQDMDQTIKGAGMPQPQEQKIEQLFVANIDISEPDASGNRVMTMDYTRVRQKMKMGRMAMVYDSADPESVNSPMAAGMAPLLAAKIDITLGPDGEVVEVSGLDRVWDEMAKTPGAAGVAKQMKEQMGNDMIRKMWATQGLMLPPGPVAPGAVWTAESTMDMPILGKADLDYTCSLAETVVKGGRPVAVVNFKGTVTAKGGAEAPMSNAELGAAKFDQEGTFTLDRDFGMITNQKTEQQGTKELAAGGQKMTIDQTMVQTLTVAPRPAEDKVSGE